MQVVVDGLENRERIVLRHEPPLDDDEYYEFCLANEDLRIERSADGEIEIMPPAGLETGFRNNGLSGQLYDWTKRDGRGRSFDSNTEYILPNGAARSPDASWVHRAKLAGLSRDEKRKFPHLVPDFVVELMSPSDRLSRTQAKMQEWIDNGVALGWLIDADRRTVMVYRQGRAPEQRVDPKELRGEEPVDGFVLDLTDIFETNL
jgi:Uma2 family endonuclease